MSCIQWNSSIVDTLGVFCIERCPHFILGTWQSVLNTEVSLFHGCPLRGVPLYTTHSLPSNTNHLLPSSKFKSETYSYLWIGPSGSRRGLYRVPIFSYPGTVPEVQYSTSKTVCVSIHRVFSSCSHLMGRLVATFIMSVGSLGVGLEDPPQPNQPLSGKERKS